nr:reverse transcriptase domain-containing protein [Tanacetum cinerariifolium]
DLNSESSSLFCILITQMVNTCQSTSEFLGPAFDEVVQRTINALLPGLTAQITNELCQNGAGGNGDQPPTIHTWLERGDSNNKRNHDRDRIQPIARNNNQKGYDQMRSDGRGYDRQNNNQRDFGQRGNDGRSYDRQGGNSGQKSYQQNRSQQYNRSSRSLSQKGYTDYASSPLCDTFNKLHPGRACHRITGACFSCGLTGHMVKDCLTNGGSGSKGNGNDNQLAANGKVFLLTRDQATNSSGLAFINHEYQSCPLRFDDKIRSANLFLQDMHNFDIILGMDWLTKHRATIVCHTKSVIFGDLDKPKFVYQHSQLGLLAFIIDTSSDGPSLET